MNNKKLMEIVNVFPIGNTATNCFKTTVMLCMAAVLLFGCNKDAGIPSNHEVQEEVLATVEGDVFVSIDKAADVGAVFFASRSNGALKKSGVRTTSTETIRDSRNNNAPAMYVMNYSDGGFVIVGATTNYYPVLAYSDDGIFTITEDIPWGLALWLDETKEAIRLSETLDEDTKNEMSSLWRNYGFRVNNISAPVRTKSYDPEQEAAFLARISELQNGEGSDYSYYSLPEAWYSGPLLDPAAYAHYCHIANMSGYPLEYTIFAIKGGYFHQEKGPLLNTVWTQGNGFDAKCSYTPAGCGTIAVAQIMRFHEKPISYNWSIMTNGSIYPSDETQNLIRDVQVQCRFFGLLFGSTSTVHSERSALEYFGYNASIHEHSTSSVFSQIFGSKPVLMGGHTNSILGIPAGDGHSWVCDGASKSYFYNQYFIEYLCGSSGNYSYTYCKEPDFTWPSLEYPAGDPGNPSIYFHMNWGWGGAHNGWYLSDELPSEANYKYHRKNIYASY